MLCVVTLCVAICAPVPASDTQAGDRGDGDSGWYESRYGWVMTKATSKDAVLVQMRVLREREATANALVRLIQTSISSDRKAMAMRLLGDMRAISAVRALIMQINFRYAFVAERGPLADHPAALALARIGQPAVRVILLDRLRREATEEELRLFARVLHEGYALESAVGRFHVRQVLEEARNRLEDDKTQPTSALTWERNLRRLLEFYNTLEDAKKN